MDLKAELGLGKRGEYVNVLCAEVGGCQIIHVVLSTSGPVKT